MKKSSVPVLVILTMVVLFSGSATLVAASDKVIKLKFAHHIPSVTLQHKYFVEFADRVKKETNGKVSITVYGGGSLVRMEDCLDSVRSGITDIGWLGYFYEASQLGLNNVMNNITLCIPGAKEGREVWNQLLSEFPKMRDEVKDFKVLLRTQSVGGNSLHTTHKPVHVPKDLKGMKIIATGESIKVIKAAGAIPLSLGSPDWYMSLERKMGDGVYAPMGVADSRGILDLTPYHTHMHLGRGIYSAIMNKQKWESLPPDVQKAFAKASAWLEEAYPETGIATFKRGNDKAKELGHEIYIPTQAELKEWRSLGNGMTKEWVKRMERLGKPGVAVYERAKVLTERYE